MTTAQVKFDDGYDNSVHGGIAVYDVNNKLEYVICGCCGSVFYPGRVRIIESMEWLFDISEGILGD